MLDYDDPFFTWGFAARPGEYWIQGRSPERPCIHRAPFSGVPSPPRRCVSWIVTEDERLSAPICAWMVDMERKNLNALFWERWEWADGGLPFYYVPCAGELRLEEPPFTRGGLLCEEMGLGKTLEIISLILWSKINELSRPSMTPIVRMGDTGRNSEIRILYLVRCSISTRD